MKRSSLKLFKNHIWFKIAKSYIPGKLGVEVSKPVPWQAGGGSFKACSPGKLGVEVSKHVPRQAWGGSFQGQRIYQQGKEFAYRKGLSHVEKSWIKLIKPCIKPSTNIHFKVLDDIIQTLSCTKCLTCPVLQQKWFQHFNMHHRCKVGTGHTAVWNC